MPHIRTEVKEVWTFDELSDSAKEVARAWFRSGNLDYEWWDFEDVSTCGKILGIDLNTKPVKLMNGSTRYNPCIYFSGFASQGDGACFEGRYEYVKGAAKAIRAHAPVDKKLHRIADALQDVQRRCFYRIEAKTKHTGYYNHSGCMSVDVWRSDDIEVMADVESEVGGALRLFADWIYSQLESEYDWRMSDECVDEDIRANEYEFDEEGKRI